MSAGGDVADLPSFIIKDRAMLTGDAAINHLDTQTLIAGRILQERILADKALLIHLDGKIQAQLMAERFFVHFMTVKRHRGFHAERVAGAQPGRDHPKGTPMLHEEIKQALGKGVGAIKFEAVFARIAGPREDDFHPFQSQRFKGVVFLGDIGQRDKLFYDLDGQRSLESQLSGGRAGVFKLSITQKARLNPVGILLRIGGIDDQEIFLLIETVNQNVIHHSTLGIGQERIACCAVLERRNIVGNEVLNGSEGILSTQINLSHVRDVEKAGLFPDRFVLDHDPGGFKLDRQFITGEFHHLAARSQHFAVKRSS